MKLTIKFCHCTIENGFISTAIGISRFSSAQPPVFGGDHEVKNTDECVKAVEAAIKQAALKPGTYTIWTKTEGRKVRKYDEWDRSVSYISVAENGVADIKFR